MKQQRSPGKLDCEPWLYPPNRPDGQVYLLGARQHQVRKSVAVPGTGSTARHFSYQGLQSLLKVNVWVA